MKMLQALGAGRRHDVRDLVLARGVKALVGEMAARFDELLAEGGAEIERELFVLLVEYQASLLRGRLDRPLAVLDISILVRRYLNSILLELVQNLWARSFRHNGGGELMEADRAR